MIGRAAFLACAALVVLGLASGCGVETYSFHESIVHLAGPGFESVDGAMTIDLDRGTYEILGHSSLKDDSLESMTGDCLMLGSTFYLDPGNKKPLIGVLNGSRQYFMLRRSRQGSIFGMPGDMGLAWGIRKTGEGQPLVGSYNIITVVYHADVVAGRVRLGLGEGWIHVEGTRFHGHLEDSMSGYRDVAGELVMSGNGSVLLHVPDLNCSLEGAVDRDGSVAFLNGVNGDSAGWMETHWFLSHNGGASLPVGEDLYRFYEYRQAAGCEGGEVLGGALVFDEAGNFLIEKEDQSLIHGTFEDVSDRILFQAENVSDRYVGIKSPFTDLIILSHEGEEVGTGGFAIALKET